MFLIKKYIPIGILLIIMAFALQNCQDNFLTSEEYFEVCPYELRYGRAHHLEVPVTVTPHQLEYQVGDTITISTIFSDSIYDLSREVSFKIENFPFEPFTKLYKFDMQFNWELGHELNEVIVDSIYQGPDPLTNHLEACYFKTQYINNQYEFSYQIVLTEPGRYCFLMTDIYEIRDRSDNAIANNIEFEGKCIDSGLRVCSVLQGDPHFDEFTSEMIHLDKRIYKDDLSRLHGVDSELFGGGSEFEWNGFFGFIVSE